MESRNNFMNVYFESGKDTVWNINLQFHFCKFLFTEMTNYSPDSSIPLTEITPPCHLGNIPSFTTRHDKIIVRCH